MADRFYNRLGRSTTAVVRVFAHGAMGSRIDPSLWTHGAISRSSQCSTIDVTKVMVCGDGAEWSFTICLTLYNRK